MSRITNVDDERREIAREVLSLPDPVCGCCYYSTGSARTSLVFSFSTRFQKPPRWKGERAPVHVAHCPVSMCLVFLCLYGNAMHNVKKAEQPITSHHLALQVAASIDVNVLNARWGNTAMAVEAGCNEPRYPHPAFTSPYPPSTALPWVGYGQSLGTHSIARQPIGVLYLYTSFSIMKGNVLAACSARIRDARSEVRPCLRGIFVQIPRHNSQATSRIKTHVRIHCPILAHCNRHHSLPQSF
jgi:hypothetical protein